MGRWQHVINGPVDRRTAAEWCMRAPVGMRIEFKEVKRSPAQNDRMWAMLTEVSQQVEWHGVRLHPEDWKLVFLDALRREIGTELRLVPNLDGNGFVNVGTSSSDLSKDEMTALIEMIAKFGAEHDVRFRDDEARAA